MIKCTNCNTENADGSRFCASCGTKLATTQACPNCGQQVNSGMAFCPYCGTSLKGPSTVISNNAVAGNMSVSGGGSAVDAAGRPVQDGNLSLRGNAVNGDMTVDASVHTTLDQSVHIGQQVNITQTNAQACHSCGKEISEPYHKCSNCKELFCDDHFEESAKLCTDCINTAVEYMQNGNQYRALKIFNRAVNSNAENPYVYYYAAICMFEGKDAFSTPRDSIKEIERLLTIAVGKNAQPEFLYLLAYVRYDYYERKHFSVQPSYRDYYQLALRQGLTDKDKEEMFALLGKPKPYCL